MEIQEYFKDTDNMIDYVSSASDTFQERPINSVDSLVLCQLAYARLEFVLDSDKSSRLRGGYLLRDFYKNEYLSEMFCDGVTDDENRELFIAAAGSRRFRDLRVKNIVSHSSEDMESQFAAVAYELDHRTDFVCFRGTDGSLVGWKEDFNLSFMDEVPAQAEAVKYIERFYGAFTEGFHRELYIGGHSKGGNLAMYAACMCRERIRERILGVYCLDSPGFRNEVFDRIVSMPGVKDLNIVKIVPHSSIIGLLMQHQNNYVVVRAKALGLFQHAAYTWVIRDGDFQNCDEVTNGGLATEKTIDDWLQKVDDEHRQVFIDSLFGILLENNIKSIEDLKHITPRKVASMIGTYSGLDAEIKHIIRKTLLNLAKASIENM